MSKTRDYKSEYLVWLLLVVLSISVMINHSQIFKLEEISVKWKCHEVETTTWYQINDTEYFWKSTFGCDVMCNNQYLYDKYDETIGNRPILTWGTFENGTYTPYRYSGNCIVTCTKEECVMV